MHGSVGDAWTLDFVVRLVAADDVVGAQLHWATCTISVYLYVYIYTHINSFAQRTVLQRLPGNFSRGYRPFSMLHALLMVLYVHNCNLNVHVHGTQALRDQVAVLEQEKAAMEARLIKSEKYGIYFPYMHI